MDRSWMKKARSSREYILGCKDFIEFAWTHRGIEMGDMIYCPCVKCKNILRRHKNVVEDHILEKGIMRDYICWTKHGEDEASTGDQNQEHDDGDDILNMLHDVFVAPNTANRDGEQMNDSSQEEHDFHNIISEEPNDEAMKFFKLLKEAETPLYPDSNKGSKLPFLVQLLHTKCLNGWTNKSFDMLLKLLGDFLPDDINLPKNHYEAKKQLRDLGLECIKIDACPNDCMLYWKDRDKDKDTCDICGMSRWKPETYDNKKKAAKILRYFPLKPRLQRLFMCSKTSKDMIWHDKGRTKDGALRHPADTDAWKILDEKYPSFGSEPRNVRLGLASDGFCPFGSMNSRYSTWPVVLCPYNLPPWMCMKKSYIFLSLLIPGPTSPGNNIDVYLQPLIDELKELWNDGVETYDAYSKAQWKSKYYKPHTNPNERLANVPPGLYNEDWEELSKFWDTEDSQDDSQSHSLIRAKQVIKHTAGRTGFAQRRNEISRKTGEEPLDGEFFVVTHCNKKTKQPLDQYAEKIIEDMQNLAGKDADGNQLPLNNEVYRACMPPEKNGRKRGWGHGVTSSIINGSHCSHRNNS